ncbi:carboxypeptidase-like regulatory domain-containing protein [Candidatus Micrarchaeota archaeon]|nr:carboxypeptidase-like regulatory domain-containing protein [Candidatus Micrarchaeota archaeon]
MKYKYENNFTYINILPILIIGVVLCGFLAISLSAAPMQPLKSSDASINSIYVSTPSQVSTTPPISKVPITQPVATRNPVPIKPAPVKPTIITPSTIKPTAVKPVPAPVAPTPIQVITKPIAGVSTVDCSNPPIITTRAVPGQIQAGQQFLVYIYIRNTNPSECETEDYSYYLNTPLEWTYTTISYSDTISVAPGLTGTIVARVYPSAEADDYDLSVVVKYNETQEVEEDISIIITPTDLIRVDLTPDEVEAIFDDMIDFNVTGYDIYGNSIPYGICEWETTIGELTAPGLLHANEFGEGNVSVNCGGLTDTSYVNIICGPTAPDIYYVDAPWVVTTNQEFSINITLENNENEVCGCKDYDVVLSYDWTEDGQISDSIILCPGESGSVVFDLAGISELGEYTYEINASDSGATVTYTNTLIVSERPELYVHVYDDVLFSGQKTTIYFILMDSNGDEYHPSQITFISNHGSVARVDSTNYTYIPPEYSAEDEINLTVKYAGEFYTRILNINTTKIDRIELVPQIATVEMGGAKHYSSTIYSDEGLEISKSPEWYVEYSSTAGHFGGYMGMILTADTPGEHEVKVVLCADNLSPVGSRRVAPPPTDDVSVRVCNGREFEDIGTITVGYDSIESLRIEPNTADIGAGEFEFIAIATNVWGVEYETSADWAVDQPSLAGLSDTTGSRIIVTGLGDGVVVLNATAGGFTAEAVLTVDAVPPVVDYIDPTPADGATTLNNLLTINVSAEDTHDVEVFFVVDEVESSTAVVDGSAAETFVLSIGEHNYSVYAVDSFGNRADLDLRTLTIIEDNATIITEDPLNNSIILTTTNIVFNISDSDGLNEIVYSVDGAAPTINYVTGTEYTIEMILSDVGTHNIEINVTDDLGVTTPFVFVYTVHAKPIINLVWPTDGLLFYTGDRLGIEVYDLDGTIDGRPEYSLDNETWTEFSDMSSGVWWTYTDSGEIGEEAVIYVRATDNDGYQTFEYFTFVYTETNHVIFDPICGSELLQGDELDITIDTTFTVSSLTWGYVEGYDYTHDPYLIATTYYHDPILINETFPEGNITVYVRWNVYHGGISRWQSAICHYNVNYPPNITLVSHANESNIYGSTILEFDITDFDGIDLSRTKFQWDSGYQILFSDPFNVPVDPAIMGDYGEHTLRVFAVDESNNELTTEKTYIFYLVEGPEIVWVNEADIVLGVIADYNVVLAGDDLVYSISSDYDIADLTYQWGWQAVPTTLGATPGEYNILIPPQFGNQNLTLYVEDIYGFSSEQTYYLLIEQFPEIIHANPINESSIVDEEYVLFTVDDNNVPELFMYYEWNNNGIFAFVDCSLGYCFVPTAPFVHGDENTLWLLLCDDNMLCSEYDFVYYGVLGAPWFTVNPVNESHVEDIVNVTAYDSIGLSQLLYNCNAGTDVIVPLTGTEDNATIECVWEEGINTVYIEVRDDDGITAEGNFVYYYDNQAPVIILESPIEGSTIAVGDLINLTINDTSDFDARYWWDSEAPETLLTPYDVIVPHLIGSHTLNVDATDIFGRTTTESYEFVIGDFPGNITGIVTDSTTGMPIPGANVSLSNHPSGTMIEWVLTDVDGAYRFTDLEPGLARYRVSVNAAGYLAESIYGITVSPSTEHVENFELDAFGQIIVTVYDASFPPNLYGMGVTVDLVSESTLETVATLETFDSTSTVIFENINPGPYWVEASEGALEGVYGPFPVYPSETRSVNVIIS